MHYAQLILDGAASTDESHAFAEGIIAEAERVAVIVRNLVALALRDEPEYAPLGIGDIVLSVKSEVGAFARVRLELRVDGARALRQAQPAREPVSQDGSSEVFS